MSDTDDMRQWETDEELDAMLPPGMMPALPPLADRNTKPVINLIGDPEIHTPDNSRRRPPQPPHRIVPCPI